MLGFCLAIPVTKAPLPLPTSTWIGLSLPNKSRHFPLASAGFKTTYCRLASNSSVAPLRFLTLIFSFHTFLGSYAKHRFPDLHYPNLDFHSIW